MRKSLVTVLLLLFLPAAARAQAGPQLTHSSVAGGGGASTQGQFRVEGTVGQAAAGASSGGSYSVEGGFRQLPKWSQTITFASLQGRTFGDSDFDVSASSSSGLGISFAAGGGCTVTGATVHITGAGSCTVTASQSGDGDYNAAADVAQTFQIAKAGQTIPFAPLPGRTFGDAPFALSAASSSGLPVSFSVVSGPASVSGSTLTINGAGAVTVRASQSGSVDYGAADAQQSFLVAKASTTTSLSSSTSAPAAGQSVTFTAAVNSGAGAPTGSVQFKANGASLGGAVALGAGGVALLATSALPAGSYVVTAEYGGDPNFDTSSGALSGSQPVGSLFEFSQGLYSSAERADSISITVKRGGDTAQAASVDYTTDDGSDASVTVPCSATSGAALDRCDYTRAAGTLHFAAGESEKSFSVLLSDDSYNEGVETTHLRLFNPSTGSALGQRPSAVLEIADDSQETTVNPIEDGEQFAFQHYHDFLNRDPDDRGLEYWKEQVANCGSPDSEVCQINVSAAFFLSIELQQTGYLVERMYRAAYGTATGNSTLGGAHQLSVPVVRYSEFLPDSQQIRQDVIVGESGWERQLETNKEAFALDFVRRQRFKDAFPSTMTAGEFVAKLDRNAGGVLTEAEKAGLSAFDPADDTKRAQVLRAVVESAAMTESEFKRAFVLMQYFGYLRRDPDAAPDSDHTGYDFWLRKLEEFGGDFIRAEMVKAFLNSEEYRRRFGH